MIDTKDFESHPVYYVMWCTWWWL